MADAHTTYATFEDLAEYARQRAIRSAARNGHQEFAYWVRVMRWAQAAANHPMTLQRWHERLLATVENREVALDRRVTAYAQMVHITKMMAAQGQDAPRNSLDWLREEAARL